MKSSFLITLVLLTLLAVSVYWVVFKISPQKLVTTGLISSTSPSSVTPEPSPTQTPQVFNYNSSTNLKSELQTVHPEVLDNDFADLKKVISTL